MPVIELGRIPGVRRAVRSQRAIQSLVSENASRLDHLGDDVAALLESAAATTTAVALTEISVGTVADSIVALRTRVADLQERIGRLEVLLGDIAIENADAAAAMLPAIETHERQSVDRMRRLELRVDGLARQLSASAVETLGAPIEAHDRRSADADCTGDLGVETGKELESEGDSFDLALCAYLAPFLREPRAIDAGAHRGRLTLALIRQGLDVIAIEPDPELASSLRETLRGEQRCSVREAAASDHLGRARFYVPEALDADNGQDPSLFGSLVERAEVMNLRFAPGPTVELLTLDEARLQEGWPDSIGLVKIDVEGEEIRAVNGLGAITPEVLMAEYWGREHPLGVHAPAPGIVPLVSSMRARGSRRWITLVHEGDRIAFMVNNHAVPPESWGNAVFFSDGPTFAAALEWCRTHLAEHPDALPGAIDLVSPP